MFMHHHGCLYHCSLTCMCMRRAIFNAERYLHNPGVPEWKLFLYL